MNIRKSEVVGGMVKRRIWTGGSKPITCSILKLSDKLSYDPDRKPWDPQVLLGLKFKVATPWQHRPNG